MSRAEIPADAIALAVSVAGRERPSPIRLGGKALRDARRRHSEQTAAAVKLLASWGLDANGQPIKAAS